MDKRGVKILISCILCTVIVSILFLLAFRISRLSCELVSVEPERLRVSQLEAFDKKRNKPIRSHDKMMLMKLSAYLEYNIMQKDADDDNNDDDGDNNNNNSNKKAKTATSTSSTSTSTTTTTTTTTSTSTTQRPGSLAGASPTPAPTPIHLNPSNGSASGQHPSPSQVQFGFSAQQLANSSFAQAPSAAAGAQQRANRRFLPLELDSIETRKLVSEGSGAQAITKQKYILSFNCTKLNMVFVYRASKVYVESMSLELKPSSNHKSSCELEMPKGGLFEVHSAAGLTSTPALSKSDHFAHYFCNKPLTYSCRHYSKHGPSSSNGLLLAELHISALEFETATLAASSSGDRKHMKHEFKSRRSECSAVI